MMAWRPWTAGMRPFGHTCNGRIKLGTILHQLPLKEPETARILEVLLAGGPQPSNGTFLNIPHMA